MHLSSAPPAACIACSALAPRTPLPSPKSPKSPNLPAWCPSQPVFTVGPMLYAGYVECSFASPVSTLLRSTSRRRLKLHNCIHSTHRHATLHSPCIHNRAPLLTHSDLTRGFFRTRTRRFPAPVTQLPSSRCPWLAVGCSLFDNPRRPTNETTTTASKTPAQRSCSTLGLVSLQSITFPSSVRHAALPHTNLKRTLGAGGQ